jgi:hypothetical protein
VVFLSAKRMLRLDETQSVFVPHPDAKQFRLGDEAANVPRHQLAFLQTELGSNEYTELREFLLNEQASRENSGARVRERLHAATAAR